MTSEAIVQVHDLTHRYGERVALAAVCFHVPRGELFGLLGPNGGGKTTLFRILSTSVPPQAGTVQIGGDDIVARRNLIRRRIGVVFQAPSLDRELTVAENLMHQGHLYGLHGAPLTVRIAESLARFGLADRAADRVKTLSGGLRRRVELAKSLLHQPSVLLLDEPSTGLDPLARRELTDHLRQLCRTDGVTVLLTTHLMEEAEQCDRLAVLDRGKLVALAAPAALKEQIGGDVIVVEAREPEPLREQIRARFGVAATVLNGTLRLERAAGHRFVTELVEAFPGQIQAVHVGKPKLEDVFVHLTGHRFEEGEP